MSCEARERLTQIYLDATENSRKVSNSIKDIHSPEWLLANKEPRQVCDSALATLKRHIRAHRCSAGPVAWAVFDAKAS